MNLDATHNDGFNRRNMEKKIHEALTQGLQSVSRVFTSISEKDLAAIEESRRSTERMVRFFFDTMREQTLTRRVNLPLFGHIKFFSLGVDCFSRSVPTRWGFKPTASLGEKTHPFDIAVHSLAAIHSLIEKNFAGYMDVEELDFEEKRNYVRHQRLGIAFNHEVGPEYAADSFALLRSKYLSRIENFLSEAAVDQTKVFVLHLYQMAQHEIAYALKISEILDARFPLGRNFVVCLVTPHVGTPVPCVPEELAAHERIRVLVEGFPFEKYVWHQDFATEQGVAFERMLMASFRRTLEALPRHSRVVEVASHPKLAVA